MFISTVITKWESKRDGRGRTAALDLPTGRTFLLNPNRITNLLSKGTGSKFNFYDVMTSKKESPSYVESNSTPQEFRTAYDTRHVSKFVALPIYRNNRLINETVITRVACEDIAYFDVCNFSATSCWVVYEIKGVKRVKALCEVTFTSIINALSGLTADDTFITADSTLYFADEMVI
jgi:hypothetical protein